MGKIQRIEKRGFRKRGMRRGGCGQIKRNANGKREEFEGKAGED